MTDPETLLEVHGFLAREARLLDEERYGDWLDLFTDDAHYLMPGIAARGRRDPEGAWSPERMAYFDDTKSDLALRVARFQAPTAWAEDPPTRHLHVVSNIEVTAAEQPDELVVRSVVVSYRSQWDIDASVLYGRREDVLRRVDGALRIARRLVLLRHSTLPAKNINTFL
ncbi:3-phenylpropionate/cinnamic acid dioxygenase subunit beta [Embleya sp. AB8]|uniref:3-phenylpropionate/cinnamic acid dioxygenase subunit beta n=1 Tax=Embleya sp. AB8 TaxID=3156304 RepID=UPI003C721F31